MTVSDPTKLGVAKLTNQQLADLALKADQDGRRARRHGDFETAAAYEQERNALLAQIN